MPRFSQLVKALEMLTQEVPAETIAWSALKELYSRSAVDFICECVKIEDRDDPNLVVPFNLWPAQKNVLETFLNNRLVIVLKARQLGLTWLVLAYAVWKMLFNPGFSVVAVSKREDDAKELTRRVEFILRHLPPYLIRYHKEQFGGPKWDSTAQTAIITHHGRSKDKRKKEPSTFQSLTSAPDTARSLTASLVILEEWAFQQWAEYIWTGAYPTINRPTGGQLIGISTARRGTLFERLWREASMGQNSIFTPVFLPWHADPRRDEAWYERTKKALPNSYWVEYPATPEEAFTMGEETAFPEFSVSTHVVDDFPIPPWWRRWAANDPGYTDPFVWYCFAADEDGNVYVYREFTRDPNDERITYSEQAKLFMDLCYCKNKDGERVPEQLDFVVTGRDAFNKHPQTGKAIVDYYREGGVKNCIQPPRQKHTDRIARKAVMHEYLKPYKDENTGKMTAKLRIFKSCHKLIETLPLLTVDKNDPEKVAECSIDHWYDACGYGLMAWHAERSTPPVPKKGFIAQHKEKLARKNARYFRRRF